jgi:hypothetical protein
MKKIKVFLILLLAFAYSKTAAQSYANAFALSVGAVTDGIGINGNYNYFLDRHDFIEASLFVTFAKYKYDNQIDKISIPYNDFTVNAGYSKNVFYNFQNTFNVNISGGGVFGYEAINKGNKELSNGSIILSKPGFIYGAYLGLDLDYSFTDQYSIFLKANGFYHANSTLGEFLPYVGVGVRFYTN